MDELIDNAPCGFLVFTDDGKIVESNATLLGLLGYERGELLDLHVEKIFSVAGRIFYQTHFFPLLKLHGKTEEIYLDLRSKAAENIPVLVNAVRHERNGTIFNDCIFVVMRRRNLYEDEILKAKKDSDAATLAKDEFLSVVSHELRTPLNAILGWAQMLQNDRTNDVIVERGLKIIRRNAQIQTQLIEDILDFSRIISGKMRLEVNQINLTSIIELAIDAITPSADTKNIQIQSILDSNCTITADADRIQQVLWNLLTNAVKFTPQGGRVQVRMQRADSSVEIEVSDTGQGISAEFLPYIFERFQQQDKTKTRRHGGLGLGLAITYRIIEMHNGTIRAESAGENQGATFIISLPETISRQRETRVPATLERVISSDKDGSIPDDSIRLNSFHILIVDDEADARELMKFILMQYGANVTAAATVPEAVEKFDTLDLDLIISDIEMPDEDGFSLIKKLNEFNERSQRKIPAIALTEHAHQSERSKVLSAGYQVHLAKPVEPAKLISVVADLARWNIQK